MFARMVELQRIFGNHESIAKLKEIIPIMKENGERLIC